MGSDEPDVSPPTGSPWDTRTRTSGQMPRVAWAPGHLAIRRTWVPTVGFDESRLSRQSLLGAVKNHSPSTGTRLA
jgi:hypothetical protein